MLFYESGYVIDYFIYFFFFSLLMLVICCNISCNMFDICIYNFEVCEVSFCHIVSMKKSFVVVENSCLDVTN